VCVCVCVSESVYIRAETVSRVCEIESVQYREEQCVCVCVCVCPAGLTEGDCTHSRCWSSHRISDLQ